MDSAPPVPRILVVDDEKSIREILTDFLSMEGWEVKAVTDGDEALVELQSGRFDLVLSDLKMPRMGGLALIEAMQQGDIRVVTVIMTGYGTVESAIGAMKRGAYDYLLKPFRVEDVVRVIRRALDRQQLEQENLRLREAVSIYRVSEAIAQSFKIERILDLIVDATVEELGADLVTLVLRDGHTEGFSERIRKRSPLGEAVGLGRLDVGELLEQLRADRPLLVHGAPAAAFFRDKQGTHGLVSFCAVPLRVEGRIIGMMSACSLTPGHQFHEAQRKMLAVLGSRAALSIENARLYEDLLHRNRALATANQTIAESYKSTLIGFAHALEESDRYTRGHSERVAFYSTLLAEALDLDDNARQTVMQAGLMHDIGKIGIRSEKLNKPGKLTVEEMAMFRTHPAKGKRILEPMPFMADLIPGAWCHHESWDGSGYPRGLAGENIPLVGRIVSVADTYDAMTSDRAYRRALPHSVAVGELQRCAGSQFDPVMVEAFVRKIEEHRSVALAEGAALPR